MFFDSWSDLGRVALVGVCAYAALVLMLRLSGNRTLSKLNAFDLVVTVALGSTLATVLLSKDVSLTEGMLAFAVLIGLQFLVTWTSVRSSRINHLVKSEPMLLFHQGRFLPGAMRRARVVEQEVMAVLRQQGVTRLDAIEAVVLETDGSMSVLRRPDEPPETLSHVRAPGPEQPLHH
ncbi:MAG TPA: YetF domain-containing protein [Archangium sp.]|nr:YetF domain-containing protein [Archangium sp.]